MFHDGEAWHPVNEKHDLFQEELIREEVERAKAAEDALLNEMNNRIYAIDSSSFNATKFKEMQEALDDGAIVSIDGEVCTFKSKIQNAGKYDYTFDSYQSVNVAGSYIRTIVTTYLVKEQGSVTKQGDEEVSIAYKGDGTKFLADDGSYKEIPNEIPVIDFDNFDQTEYNKLLSTPSAIIVMSAGNPYFATWVQSGKSGDYTQRWYRRIEPMAGLEGMLLTEYYFDSDLDHTKTSLYFIKDLIFAFNTSLSSLSWEKDVHKITIDSDASLTFESNNRVRKEVHVFINNSSTSDVTVTLPTASPYICISSDSLTVPASGYAEVNAISDGTNIYLRAL